MFSSKIPIDRNVCFFGIGALIEECFDQLVSAIGRSPNFFCDNASDKWGQFYFGTKCISPRTLANLAENTVVVITVKNHEAILEQLIKLGIKEIYLALYKRAYNAIGRVERLPFRDDLSQRLVHPVNSVRGKWTLVTGASRGLRACYRHRDGTTGFQRHCPWQMQGKHRRSRSGVLCIWGADACCWRQTRKSR